MKIHKLLEEIKEKIPDGNANSLDIEIVTSDARYTFKQDYQDARVKYKKEEQDELL